MPDPTTAVAGTLLAAGDAPPAWELGTVTGYTAGAATLGVRLNGTDVVVRRAKTYTPVVGEAVVLGRIGSGLFAVAALA